MQQRDQRQVVSRIVLSLPEELRLVRQRVSDSPEATFQERGETRVLGPLCVGA
jgi:hypothetical protein